VLAGEKSVGFAAWLGVCIMAAMVFRQVVGALAIVTFAASSMVCCCRPSLAATQAAESESGCHGHGHRSSPDAKDTPSSHDEQDNCQHCHRAQLLESRDAAKASAAPALHPVLVVAIAIVVFSSADHVSLHRSVPSSRAAPPPLYLLKRVFLI